MSQDSTMTTPSSNARGNETKDSQHPHLALNEIILSSMSQRSIVAHPWNHLEIGKVHLHFAHFCLYEHLINTLAQIFAH
ncbi:hypothetical protein SUGI_0075990 [Cryptomeria japonica]|nr:hypothetical protein SUGI_0075990 [Cryptomeria japonica]